MTFTCMKCCADTGNAEAIRKAITENVCWSPRDYGLSGDLEGVDDAVEAICALLETPTAAVDGSQTRLADVSKNAAETNTSPGPVNAGVIAGGGSDNASRIAALEEVLREIIGTTDGFYTVAMPQKLRDRALVALADTPSPAAGTTQAGLATRRRTDASQAPGMPSNPSDQP